MPLPFVAMAAYAVGNSLMSSYQQNKQRKKIGGIIGDIRKQRGRLAHSNRTAYSNAVTAMAANRNNPNGWQFASSTYNATLGANAQKDSQYSQQITQLKANRPDHLSGWDMAGKAGMEVGKGYIVNKMMDDGDDGSDGGFWDFAKKPAVRKTGSTLFYDQESAYNRSNANAYNPGDYMEDSFRRLN